MDTTEGAAAGASATASQDSACTGSPPSVGAAAAAAAVGVLGEDWATRLTEKYGRLYDRKRADKAEETQVLMASNRTRIQESMALEQQRLKELAGRMHAKTAIARTPKPDPRTGNLPCMAGIKDFRGKALDRVPAILVPKEQPLPPFCTWVPLRRNLLVEDETILRHIPYFGDEDTDAFINELFSNYEDNLVGGQDESSDEYIINELLVELVDDLIASSPQLKGEDGQIDMRVYQVLGAKMSPPRKASELKQRYVAIKKKIGKSEPLAQMTPDVDSATANVTADKVMDSYHSLFCRRCYTYDCRYHAFRPLPTAKPDSSAVRRAGECGHSCWKTVNPESKLTAAGKPQWRARQETPRCPLSHPMVLSDRRRFSCSNCKRLLSGKAYACAQPSCKELLCAGCASCDPDCLLVQGQRTEAMQGQQRGSRRQSPRKSQEGAAAQASPASAPAAGGSKRAAERSPFRARKRARASGASGEAASAVWTSAEVVLLDRGQSMFGKTDFCSLAEFVGSKSCSEVHSYILAKEGVAVLSRRAEQAGSAHQPKGKQQKKRRGAKSVVHQVRKPGSRDTTIFDYSPCDHPGQPCNENCSCIATNNFCEKYCQCSPDCRNRFPGCKCKGSCDTRACPCLAALRECDPDLCTSCGACDLGSTQCKNVMIQRQMHQHLLLAPSDVAGWGIFLKDSVTKGQFISEYCGEVISQDEADRRGKVYDKYMCSFLFNLNQDYVVDATRKGNKIRFANHANAPNCVARVMMVNGDYRIGIFAKTAIAAGKELFFDYRYGPTDALKYVSVQREEADI